jgi:hypothetical protein
MSLVEGRSAADRCAVTEDSNRSVGNIMSICYSSQIFASAITTRPRVDHRSKMINLKRLVDLHPSLAPRCSCRNGHSDTAHVHPNVHATKYQTKPVSSLVVYATAKNTAFIYVLRSMCQLVHFFLIFY